ncbi:MAG: hypothetical protein AB8I08_35330 [Sandaracinaceae bacterium]
MRKTGDTSAEVQIQGNALIGIPYWRTALVGLLEGATLVFADEAHVALAPRATAMSVTYQLEWR